nr:hypothetical protein [Aporhodopirellula aestuarii]
MNHRLASRHRRIKLFPQRNDVDLVFFKERPQIHKVLEAACDAIEFETDHQVDVACRDVAFESL